MNLIGRKRELETLEKFREGDGYDLGWYTAGGVSGRAVFSPPFPRERKR